MTTSKRDVTPFETLPLSKWASILNEIGSGLIKGLGTFERPIGVGPYVSVDREGRILYELRDLITVRFTLRGSKDTSVISRVFNGLSLVDFAQIEVRAHKLSRATLFYEMTAGAIAEITPDEFYWLNLITEDQLELLRLASPVPLPPIHRDDFGEFFRSSEVLEWHRRIAALRAAEEGAPR
jgi:hypothetical protein